MGVRTDLGLAEAVRGLDEQRAMVDTIQQRAGVLLAFAAIANVGLGQLAFAGEGGLPFPPVAIIGIVAAVTCGVLLLSLCWPRSYRFTLPPMEIVTAAPPFNVADDELVGKVAAAMGVLRDRQEQRVERLNHVMRIAIGAVVVNASAWSVIAMGV
jgi:hypothetical protein